MADDDWRVHALAAVAEGWCPNGHGPLRALRLEVADGGFRWVPADGPARYCGACGHNGCWYSVYADVGAPPPPEVSS